MNQSRKNSIKDLKFLSEILDSRFNGPLGIKFGLDSVVGLIPVVGDTVTSFIGSYIILKAANLGTPKIILVRMALNIFIDQILGSLPILGDIFDLFWKSNNKNYQLIEKYIEKPTQALGTSWLTMLLVIVLVIALMLMPIFLFYLILNLVRN